MYLLQNLINIPYYGIILEKYLEVVSMHELMILGTFHFHSPDNGDRFHSAAAIPERQQEILDVVEILERFCPTKIAVEHKPEFSAKLLEQYQAYVRGETGLGPGEVQQIAFRLAKRLEHRQLYCVDWNEAVPYVGSVFQWMSEHTSEHIEELDRRAETVYAREQEHLANSTLLEHFILLNQPSRALEDHKSYLDYALLGDEQDPAGAKWVAQYWYYRNLRIWKNVTELFQDPDEKILLLIGAGHLHYLRQIFSDAGTVRMVDTVDFLSIR